MSQRAKDNKKDTPTRERLRRLPKWVQKHIEHLQYEVERRNGLVTAHAILLDKQRDWFVIPNNSEEVKTLWYCKGDAPVAICSIGKNDVLLIGRAGKRAE